jgi:hypothetical protein
METLPHTGDKLKAIEGFHHFEVVNWVGIPELGAINQ